MPGCHVSRLFTYPVKSLRGYAVESAALDPLGIAGDRRFLVVDPAGQFLTQRGVSRMARVSAALDGADLRLSADGHGSIRVPRTAPAGSAPREIRATVWQSEDLKTEDCGDEPAAWLTGFLGRPCRLVRAAEGFARPMLDRKVPSDLRNRPGIAFPDGFPFMILGESTLDELNSRLVAQGGPALPMERFRPSFVVSGAEPFAEDRWRRFRIGGVEFRAGGPCARCLITTLDPWTGETGGAEPLRTLATYRRDRDKPTHVNFGQNVIHLAPTGRIRVGDPVEILDEG